MNVLLVANYLPDDQTSMLAFYRMLERGLPRLGCNVRVVSAPKRVLCVPESSRWWKWLGYIDKFVLFIPALRRAARWADVVHVCDHSNGMYVPWTRKIKPTVITCHDVIAIQAARGMVEGWHVGRSGRLFQGLISKGLSLAQLVACVSHNTRRDLLALGLASERIAPTVMLGLNEDFSPVPPDEAQRLIDRFGLSASDKYLLHVGSDLPRKNRRTVLETFIVLQQRAAASGRTALAEQLVFVGQELSPEMSEMACANGVADRVKVVKGVSHEELCALYTRATALVFPSLQEGFGWPPIEAQACGCPVFSSDLPPMNEVAGECAVYVDPHDAQQIATAIEEAAPRFADMSRLGRAHATQYLPHKMVAGYVETYQRVIAERNEPMPATRA